MRKFLVLLVAVSLVLFVVSPAYSELLTEHQSVSTNGAYDWESFSIGSDTYLAVANYGNDSSIYKWDGTQFTDFQSIHTFAALDWESFSIGSDIYLVVANSVNDSSIYKWDGTQFTEFQSIPTNEAIDWESFTIGSDIYLAVANRHNGATRNINSQIYKWDGTQFTEFQSIPTNGASDWESFTIGSDIYLAVANGFNDSTHNINSKIYKWDGAQFTEFQSIPTNSALAWESFTIGSDIYLAVANNYNGSTFNTNSKIYKWDGAQFTDFQSIPTIGAFDWESFSTGSDIYLAVANWSNGSTFNINSKIYKWDDAQFTEIQSIPTSGAVDWESFTIGSEIYFSVANYYNGSTQNIDSKIYKANIENPVITALTTTPDPASGDAPLTVGFSITVIGGTSPYAYSWDFGDGGVATTQNPSHTYTIEGSYTARVTVTDSEGASATRTVDIEATPAGQPLSVTLTASPTSGMPPLIVDFTSSAGGGTEPYTYLWEFGDTETGSEQEPSHTYTAVGTYTAQITVTDSADNTATNAIDITVQSGECPDHAVFDSNTNLLTIPYLDVPLLNPITQEASGEYAVFDCEMKLLDNSVGSFTVTGLTYLENQDRDPCHATYSYDGIMYIPNVDVTSVIILPPDIVVPGPVETFEITLEQLPISTSVFHLDNAVLRP